MKKKLFSLAAASLLTVGFLGGNLTNPLKSGTTTTKASSNVSVSVSPSAIDQVIESAFQEIQKSVVYVQNGNSSSGSGIVYDSAGDIVTNAHVVSGGHSFKVTFSSGKTVTATLVGSDATDDLAVLHVATSNLVPANFAPKSSYQLAETVLAVGSPLGLKDTVTDGLISGLDRTEEETTGSYIPDAIQTSAPINPGNSGGALADLNGEVVGIPTMVQTATTDGESVQNVGFAIPSSRVTFIVPQLIKYGHVVNTGRAYLGVSVGDTTDNGYVGPFGQQGASQVNGAVIESLKTDSPAATAGLQTGDTITRFAGTRVTDSSDLLSAMADAEPGQSVKIRYYRGASPRSATVKLGTLPASD
jgi:putative serine protease PepD